MERGCPSHHPLVAFVRETGDCLGVRWTGGSAHTADGVAVWIRVPRHTGRCTRRARTVSPGPVPVSLDTARISCIISCLLNASPRMAHAIQGRAKRD